MEIKRRGFLKLLAVTPLAWQDTVAGVEHEIIEEVPQLSPADLVDVEWNSSEEFMQPLRLVLSDMSMKMEYEFYFEIPARSFLENGGATIRPINDYKMVVEEDAMLHRLEVKVPRYMSDMLQKEWILLPSVLEPTFLQEGSFLTIVFNDSGLLTLGE